MSEIDDIFASNGKWKPPSPPSKEKKGKGKAQQPNPSLKTDVVVPSSKKRPLPETIVDTSTLSPGPSKRHKGAPVSTVVKKKKPKSIALKKSNADAEFNDSRGCEGRRKTEEGWSIYKADELGIGDQGGDTPLCPFDCNCFIVRLFRSLSNRFSTIDQLIVEKLWPKNF